MATIPVASLPQKKVKPRELLAELCFYYPQYTLAAARRLPARDVFLLLNTARRMKAVEYFQLTQIAAAPHTRGGVGVKKLSKQFKAATE